VGLLIAASAIAAADHSAAHLAAEARRAQNSGQVVRAYLLFTEASMRDPQNASYAVERDALKPLAKLMVESHVQDRPDITSDIRAAEAASDAEPMQEADGKETEAAIVSSLQPPPHLEPQPGSQNFDLHGDDRSILRQIAQRFGVETTFDPGFETGLSRHLVLDEVDFESAMSAATAATGTFAFATAPRRIFVARDTESKRSEFEPEVVVTVDLPDAIDSRDVVDAANAVRGAIGLRGVVTWSPTEHKVIIHDHPERARVAAALLEQLVLPRAQVSFEVQMMAIDSDRTYVYGINWQTSYQLLPLGLFTRLHNPSLPSIVNATNFLPFGGGASLLGIGLADASLVANYTASYSSVLFDATLMVGSGQSGTLHVGDKYPIATALYSGPQQTGSAAAYNPIGQVTEEDLGLSLKLTPHVTAAGDVYVDLEAAYETLGNQGLDGVPSVNQRAFKGSLMMQEGQWAVIGGMKEDDRSLSKTGFPVAGEMPGLAALFGQTTRDHRKSDTLLVIKPTITRLPMSSDPLRAYVLGPHGGARTLF
jgi:type II secretory pathway component GspD/PulD (secretin)